MSKKSVLASIFLICVGIIMGVVLVSSFRGVIEPGFAGDPQVTLGAPSQVHSPAVNAKGLSKAFVAVSRAVTPTVVSIIVTTRVKEKSEDLRDFFHFFGPDFKFKEPEPQQGAGSGVIINPKGYILTNNHVVDGADDDGVQVILSDTRRMKGKVLGTDPTTDLAVVKVEGDDLPTAAFGNSDSLEVGEWVLAVGNPLGLQSTVTAGIVSYMGRNIGIIGADYGIENFIQTDAAINPGNSGGPLVNLDGEIVGINSAIATTNARYQGYGFAIPVNLARVVAEDIIKYGKVRRGYIGVNIQDVDETMARALGMDHAHGVFIQNLVDGGAAEAAGLKEQDVILSVDGKSVNKANELQSFIARKHPGEDVKLKIYRDGKTFEKLVTLRDRKTETVAASDRERPSGEEEPDREASTSSVTIGGLGLEVASLSSSQRKESDVDNGVVVQDVKPFSEAFNRQIRKGDIIIEADKKDIGSPKELRRIVQNHKPGGGLLLRVKRGSDRTFFVALQIPK